MSFAPQTSSFDGVWNNSWGCNWFARARFRKAGMRQTHNLHVATEDL